MVASVSADGLEIPKDLHVLPLRSAVLFPGAFIPFDVGRQRSVAAIDRAGSGLIAVVCQRDPNADFPDMQLYEVGCASKIVKVIKISEGKVSVIVQGLERIRITEIDRAGPSFVAAIECIRDPSDTDELLLRKAEILRDETKALMSSSPELPKQAATVLDGIVRPGRLADFIVANLDASVEDKQRALETFSLARRIDLALEYVRRSAS
jgi:ATP-dependent Lon protease